MTAVLAFAALLALGQVPEQKPMTPEEVHAAVVKTLMSTAGAIDACTAAYVAEYPTGEGKVTLDVTVVKSGAVGNAVAKTSLDGARNLRPCLETVARKWKFPPIHRESEPLSLTVAVKKGAKFVIRKPGEKAPEPAPGQPSTEEEGFVQFTPQAWGGGS